MQTSPRSRALRLVPKPAAPPPVVAQPTFKVFLPNGHGFPGRVRGLFSDGEYERLQGKAREAILEATDHLNIYGAVVVLLGPRSHGKTTIATLLSHNYQVETLDWPTWGKGAVSREARAAYYWTLGDLFGHAKAEWDRRHEPDATSVLDTARLCRLLVLDELHEALGTDWERSQFIRLIDTRYREGRATILLSNASPEGFRDAVGDSVVSRLQEVGMIVECDWESRR